MADKRIIPGGAGAKDIPAREVQSPEIKRIEALESAVASLKHELKQVTQFIETLRAGK